MRANCKAFHMPRPRLAQAESFRAVCEAKPATIKPSSAVSVVKAVCCVPALVTFRPVARCLLCPPVSSAGRRCVAETGLPGVFSRVLRTGVRCLWASASSSGAGAEGLLFRVLLGRRPVDGMLGLSWAVGPREPLVIPDEATTKPGSVSVLGAVLLDESVPVLRCLGRADS